VTADFGAAPSALGYMYQCELALLELLRRRDPSLDVSIELLDDIAFEGAQTTLLQSKLHIKQGSLSDGSPDLWKTLRVWSESSRTHPDAQLVLLTTSSAPSGSIAELLRSEGRDAARAHDRLVQLAQASTGATMKSARDAFLSLTEDERRALVDRVVIADGGPQIGDLDAEFEKALSLAAPRQTRAALTTRLREWWLRRAERHLVDVASGAQSRISGLEIEDRIADLRDQLAEDNLPVDFEGLEPPSDEAVAEDQRAFVMQLRLICLSNARIRAAIHDHHRAFAQRARWVREDLVRLGELEAYERRLREEWNRLWLPETDDEFEGLDEEASRARGREVHRACSEASIEPIRARVSAAFIQRGSLHALADELEIGWHHDWVARMQKVLEAVE
jgi:hypothetical protein